MYNWVTRRTIARTETSSYPTRTAQTVDAVVSLWAPAFAALLACSMTPARAKLDARYYDAPTYPVRAAQTVDATVRTWIPAFDADLERTRQRASLDVRRYEWTSEEAAWLSGILATPPTTAQTVPAFQTSGIRTPDRPRLDVRSYDWNTDEASWIQATQTVAPTVAQTWPAFQILGLRTADRARLDVRRYEWAVDESAWIQSIPAPGAPSVAQTLPAFHAAAQFRTPAAQRDVFRAPVIEDVVRVPDDWITWTPIQDHGGRTADRARLDVRAYDWGQPAWITTSFTPPVVTDAQKWPGIVDRGLSYRTAGRLALDVRAVDQPAFTWVRPVVDAALAKFVPVFSGEIASFRTGERPRLEVRRYDWAPSESSWVFVNLTARAFPWLYYQQMRAR